MCREFKPVLTKRDFTERYAAGEFGNHSPTWHTLNDFMLSLDGKWDEKLYHLRNRVAGGETYYNIAGLEAEFLWKKQSNQTDFYVSEMAPTEKTIIQGELMRSTNGLYLHYSMEPRPMREALSLRSYHIYGIMADSILRHYMDPQSYEWTMELLNRYPDHVVEFSTYSIEWGTVPGYNTVWWEVRKY